eukprot:m.307233 g.307233  ORF g.307233 m.307233 type:complete len:153 (-) comp55312_c0_seq12:702-1160(-)
MDRGAKSQVLPGCYSHSHHVQSGRQESSSQIAERAVTAGGEGRIIAWDLETGVKIKDVSESTGVYALAAHERGTEFVSVGNDKELRIWSTDDYSCLVAGIFDHLAVLVRWRPFTTMRGCELGHKDRCPLVPGSQAVASVWNCLLRPYVPVAC